MNVEPQESSNDKPFVAHLVTSQLSVRTILRSKLKGLADRGYRQIVIAGPDGVETTPPQGVKLYDVDMARSISPFRDWRSLRAIKNILRRERPDIVHTRTAKAGFLGRLGARQAGIPIIVHTTHGLPYHYAQSPLAFRLYRALERRAGRWSTFLLSQNRDDFDRIINDGLITPQRAGWEGNGVDVGALTSHDAAAGRKRIRAEFGVASDEVLCVMLARLEPIKRVDRFIQAMVRTKAGSLRCVIAGDGPTRDTLEEQAAEAKLSRRLEFMGLRSDPWDLLAAADIVCLTSDKEGLPRSIMEAMALQRCVVATDVPGTCEVVRNGRTGLLVPRDDSAALAAALDKLAGDPALRQQFGNAGFERVSRYFNEKDVLDRLERLYTGLRRGELPALSPSMDAAGA